MNRKVRKLDKDTQIKLKNEYLTLIIDVGIDYDGYDGDVEGLKGVIDTMMEYARKALYNDVTSPIYERGDGKKINILMEEV